MTRAYRRGWAAVVVVATVLLTTGCGSLGRTEDEPVHRAATELTAAAAAVRDARTLRASIEFRQSGGTVLGGGLSGRADVVVGHGVSLTYTYQPSTTVERNNKNIEGELRTVGDRAFARSSRWKPPAGKEWFSTNPATRAKLDVAVPPEWLAMTMSKLLDPLFILGQGVADVPDLTSAPATVDGVTTTKYMATWNLTTDGAGPEMTAWAARIGDMVSMELSLYLSPEGRPVRLEVNSSTAVMLFDAKVLFSDYGAAIVVEAPAADRVAQP
ncbi:hypothetical protein GCM10027290_01210 [Micromonospora sonneratiae]|uniref:Lipoprotein n=1 Tax=Micromonospora sonneratiae TaxID=1184706 RepID=A0ABW3Y5U7_9ACTN